MKGNKKILIAGVGGQGIVYLTNIIVEAAMLSDIPVCVSEIHGLSQRGGVVTAGIGLGKHCTGFIGKANVDLLIGLEPLETQRCVSHLHKNSSVIFGNYKIAPYSVNAETAQYPEINPFIYYLKSQIDKLIFINELPKEISAVLQNIYFLGVATQAKCLPFSRKIIEMAIRNTVMDYHLENTIDIFNKGLNFNMDTKAISSVQ